MEQNLVSFGSSQETLLGLAGLQKLALCMHNFHSSRRHLLAIAEIFIFNSSEHLIKPT